MWDIIAATPVLSDFRAAIEGAGLEDVFQDPDEEMTVLAPVNDAFEGQTGALDVEDYIIDGELTAAELFQLDEITTRSGAILAIDEATQTIGGAVMSQSRDVGASNGLLQVMNGLVQP